MVNNIEEKELGPTLTLRVSFSCFRYRQWEVSHRNWRFCFCREPLGSATAINDGGSLAGVELHLAKDGASPAAGGVQAGVACRRMRRAWEKLYLGGLLPVAPPIPTQMKIKDNIKRTSSKKCSKKVEVQ